MPALHWTRFRLCCAKSNCRNTRSTQCRSWARSDCMERSSILRGKLLTLAFSLKTCRDLHILCVGLARYEHKISSVTRRVVTSLLPDRMYESHYRNFFTLRYFRLLHILKDSGNGLLSYARGARFEYWPGRWLSWVSSWSSSVPPDKHRDGTSIWERTFPLESIPINHVSAILPPLLVYQDIYRQRLRTDIP